MWQLSKQWLQDSTAAVAHLRWTYLMLQLVGWLAASFELLFSTGLLLRHLVSWYTWLQLFVELCGLKFLIVLESVRQNYRSALCVMVYTQMNNALFCRSGYAALASCIQ